MTVPQASYVQLPSDSGNSGKKIRTQTKVVGSDTVHEHFFVPVSRQSILQLAYFQTGAVKAVTASAENGTSTGTFWFQVPSAASIRARIRYLEVQFAHTTATAVDHLTAPRIAFQKFTFTGTASGATISHLVQKTGLAMTCDVRTAVTGMTVSLDNIFWVASPQSFDFTTSGATPTPSSYLWRTSFEDEFLDLGPAEGLVCYQADAGTTSDQRSYRVIGCWDEYDNS